MIYAKWKLTWQGEPSEGYGPDSIVVGRGDSIEGAFFVGAPQDWIYGYLNDGFDFDGLDAWQITEVTQAEIVSEAQKVNKNYVLLKNGKLYLPVSGD